MSPVPPPTGVLVMAYGTASGPDDVERYYTDIRGGRPPAAQHLRELKERFAAIGDRFPLLDITRRQAEGLERALNAGSDGRRFRTFLGMKHSPPFIDQGVAAMRQAGIERAVGLVMAPHWSGMSIETYIERVNATAAEGSGGPAFDFVRAWYKHPGFVEFLSSRVSDALDRLSRAQRRGAVVIFSAHSLPQRGMPDGTSRCLRCHTDWCTNGCRYKTELEDNAKIVAEAVGLHEEQYTVAWQSAGRTADPWLGPSMEDVIRDVAAAGHRAVVACSAGFVADHLEILYDLDIEARRAAQERGMAFVRTEMPNADPRFVEILARVVREHLREPAPTRSAWAQA